MDFLKSLAPVDWAILGILLGAFLIGWFRGLIRFLTGFLSFLIALLVAGRYSDRVVEWLNQNWRIQERFEAILYNRLQLPPETVQPVEAPLPQGTALDWTRALPVPGLYREPLAQQVAQMSTERSGVAAADHLVQQVASGLLSAFVFVLLVLLLSFMITRLGSLLADQVHAIPLVGTADRILGGAALLLETSLVLSFALIWLVPMLTLYGFPGLGEAVDQAETPTYLMLFFEWIRGLLLGGGTRLWNV